MKSIPKSASQHATAGPYSPVIEVVCGRLIVTYGQAAIAADGAVVGQFIAEQTEHTAKLSEPTEFCRGLAAARSHRGANRALADTEGRNRNVGDAAVRSPIDHGHR